MPNLPYVPAMTDPLIARGLAPARGPGSGGRALLDRLCERAPARLRPGGVLSR